MRKRLLSFFLSLTVLAGCASPEAEPEPQEPEIPVIKAQDGLAQGGIGDILRTYWFDFTIDSAEKTESYGGIRAQEEDNILLVVHISMTSTFPEEIPMSDYDFDVEWEGGDDALAYPVTLEHPDQQTGAMLESAYLIGPGETVSGDLVFEVPAGQKDFAVYFLEFFEDETEGDLFEVRFTAE